ncbi:SDR family NAD(P)-dependent oxidoreductase [Bradyrhizobium sp. 138]|uniref:SDR family oxidoreductase n=1 Tax=Bradyrhizobium sp. 138 TaxID=2782615 RepID=UPI002097DF37|nr:SDR family NAD(P)-dependent oxidoreductase [Bradyrhizobium sp. 138]
MHLTPRHRGILDLDLAAWDQTMATNLRGMLLCCRQAISPAAVAIVNMSSCQELSGDTAQTSYAASKAAMKMLSASLATQYGHAQIRCNAIAPGLGMTECLLAKLDECMQRHQRRLLPRVGCTEGRGRAGGVPALRRCCVHHRPGRVHRRRHAGACADVRRRWQQPRRAACRHTAEAAAAPRC